MHFCIVVCLYCRIFFCIVVFFLFFGWLVRHCLSNYIDVDFVFFRAGVVRGRVKVALMEAEAGLGARVGVESTAVKVRASASLEWVASGWVGGGVRAAIPQALIYGG